jgi:hypothetical protein
LTIVWGIFTEQASQLHPILWLGFCSNFGFNPYIFRKTPNTFESNTKITINGNYANFKGGGSNTILIK